MKYLLLKSIWYPGVSRDLDITNKLYGATFFSVFFYFIFFLIFMFNVLWTMKLPPDFPSERGKVDNNRIFILF